MLWSRFEETGDAITRQLNFEMDDECIRGEHISFPKAEHPSVPRDSFKRNDTTGPQNKDSVRALSDEAVSGSNPTRIVGFDSHDHVYLWARRGLVVHYYVTGDERVGFTVDLQIVNGGLVANGVNCLDPIHSQPIVTAHEQPVTRCELANLPELGLFDVPERMVPGDLYMTSTNGSNDQVFVGSHRAIRSNLRGRLAPRIRIHADDSVTHVEGFDGDRP